MSGILDYSILLAIALSSEILFLAIGAGVAMHPYSSWLNLKAALIFSFTQFLMAMFGINLGAIITSYIPDFYYPVGLLLIAFVGLKFILEANKIKNEKRTFLIEDKKILLSLSLAASINPFLAFIGFGMIMEKFSIVPAFILPVFVFFTVLTGIFIGNKYRPARIGRFIKYFGGLIFIYLTIYLLFQ